ncbi:uncharacterized protein LOC144647255 [Oculina patagonica]
MVSSSMDKPSMEDTTGTKVVFDGGSKSANSVSKNHPRRTALVIIGLAVLLFLVAVVLSAAGYRRREKERTKSSTCSVAEVNLEQGEILMYEVEQKLEIRGGDVQKGTIIAIVEIRVLNKTSEEYWFLMKINITVEGDNVGNMGGVKSGITDYFLIKLKVTSRLKSTHANNETAESFELYGHQKTDGDFLRYVYSIVNQLLPAVKQDLYEDVDGKRVNPKNELNPEISPLFPGAVKMHRKANTSDKTAVLIENHFNRTDLVNVSSEIDLDMTYSDLMFINKTNGMVTESRAYLSEQLNFGEPIHSKSGFDITKMNVTLLSKITLIEDSPSSSHLADAEFAAVKTRAFVKLVLPKSDAYFTLNEKPVEAANICLNSSGSSFNDSDCSNTNTTGPHSTVKRTRRAGRFTRNRWNGLNKQNLRATIRRTPTLFEKKVIGINVKGETNVWLTPKHRHRFEVGVGFTLRFGSLSVGLFHKRFNDQQIKRGSFIRIRNKWEKRFAIEVPVYFLRLGVEFSLWIPVDITLRFPHRENSLSPPKLAVEIEPSVAVTTSLAGYVSVYVLRAGVYGDGTLVRGSLPVKLSYRADRYPGRKWCLALSARMTAIELEAGIFYQWISCKWSWFWFKCDWGDRSTLYRFGKWAAYRFNWKLFETCF